MGKPRNFVGRCIYCDSTEGLSREHIVPEGIGGRIVPDGRHEALVLGDATCGICKEIIGGMKGVEGIVQNKMMGDFRAAADMNRKGRKQKTRKFRTPDGEGGWNEVEIDVDQLCPLLLLPTYSQIGFLSGRHRYDILPDNPVVIIVDKDRVEGYRGNAQLQSDIFGRMIAKIALGIAVSELGIDGFRPLIRDFILGKPEHACYWIGGLMRPGDPGDPDVLYRLGLSEVSHGGKTYVTALIHLFAMFGGPQYYVIVGEYPPEPS